MTNLTDEQKQIQDRAAYGLPQQAPSLDVGAMTHEKIEWLRGLIFQHDAQNAAMTREFDLNKPPTPPYRHQEFPRLLYRDGKTMAATTKAALEEMLKSGWSMDPPPTMEVNLGGELTAEMKAEAAAIDAQLHQPSVKDLMAEIEALKARLDSSIEKPPPRKKEPSGLAKYRARMKELKEQERAAAQRAAAPSE